MWLAFEQTFQMKYLFAFNFTFVLQFYSAWHVGDHLFHFEYFAFLLGHRVQEWGTAGYEFDTACGATSIGISLGAQVYCELFWLQLHFRAGNSNLQIHE